MPDESREPDFGEQFLSACIDFLKSQKLRIKKGMGSLEALRSMANQIDPDDLEAMARAIMDRTMNPHLQAHGGSTVVSRPAPDPDVDQIPISPPRAATSRELAGYHSIVGFLLKSGNRWASDGSLRFSGELSQLTLATILRMTHADKFEMDRFPNGKSKWRLKPEVFESLSKFRENDASLEAKSGEPTEATIGMNLFSPPVASMTQTEAAAHVLKLSGVPLSTNDIVARIVRLGLYRVEGDHKQFVNSIFSAMRRKPDTFVKQGRGMWGLQEWGRRGGANE